MFTMRFALTLNKPFLTAVLTILLVGSSATDPRGTALVGLAHPMNSFRVQAIPNDPFFADQWGLQNSGPTPNIFRATSGADISAARAWDVTKGDPSIIVAVVDTGVDSAHPDLFPNLWMDPATGAYGRNFVSRNDANGQTVLDPRDVHDINGHGTAMVSILAARGDNQIGISGVAWAGKVMVLKAFDENGNVQLSSATSNHVSEAIDFAVTNGARIINLSFGTIAGVDPNCPECLTNSPEFLALARARDAGVLVVAAACNQGQDNDANGGSCFPASFDLDNIVAVAASDAVDHIAKFSSYGRINVDLAAPGERVLASTSRWNTVKKCASANGILTTCGAIDTGTNSVCRAVMSVSSTSTSLQGGTVKWADDSLGPVVSSQILRKLSFVPASITGGTEVYADLKALSNHGKAYQILVEWASQAVTTNSIEIQCRDDGISGTPKYFSGTSAAAAFVSGAAALLLADDPNQDYRSLRARILNSVDPLPLASDAERVASGGRLNVAGALGLPAVAPVVQTSSASASGGGGTMGLFFLWPGLWLMLRKRKGALPDG